MTLQQLKYIVAIDRQRNFAKAAEQCGISQPTLSAMLVKLEEELDVRIFERNNKLVTPTAAGEKIRQGRRGWRVGALCRSYHCALHLAQVHQALYGTLSDGKTLSP